MKFVIPIFVIFILQKTSVYNEDQDGSIKSIVKELMKEEISKSILNATKQVRKTLKEALDFVDDAIKAEKKCSTCIQDFLGITHEDFKNEDCSKENCTIKPRFNSNELKNISNLPPLSRLVAVKAFNSVLNDDKPPTKSSIKKGGKSKLKYSKQHKLDGIEETTKGSKQVMPKPTRRPLGVIYRYHQQASSQPQPQIQQPQQSQQPQQTTQQPILKTTPKLFKPIDQYSDKNGNCIAPCGNECAPNCSYDCCYSFIIQPSIAGSCNPACYTQCYDYCPPHCCNNSLGIKRSVKDNSKRKRNLFNKLSDLDY